MDAQATGGFLRFFRDLPDPRAANVVHRLSDIVLIAVCAVICGAQGWVEVETFGQAKLPWLRTFLDLPHGIPSHDTFGRVFAALDPDAFEGCFMKWMSWLRGQGGGRLIAIDGKSIRRSFAHAWDASGMAHLVSAFATENRLVLAQLAADGKGQELQAMRRLIDLLALDETTVVTVDALGCQRDLAQRILSKDADYVLAVKSNQPALHAAVSRLLDEALLEGFAGLRHGHCQTVDGDHGRIETRQTWVSDELAQHPPPQLLDQWPALASLVVVQSLREVAGSDKGIGTERRYYISSLDGTNAQRMSQVIRGHWGIENNLHWQLDVSFGEDLRRVRKDHAAENFSRLCRIALNLLKQDSATKLGIKAKRLKAGWDEPYLLHLLTG